MSVREYRDAIRKSERIQEVIIDMKNDLDFKILRLNQDIIDAEAELADDRKKVLDLGTKLIDKFMIKVDDDVVFRLDKHEPIQIIKIMEE